MFSPKMFPKSVRFLVVHFPDELSCCDNILDILQLSRHYVVRCVQNTVLCWGKYEYVEEIPGHMVVSIRVSFLTDLDASLFALEVPCFP